MLLDGSIIDLLVFLLLVDIVAHVDLDLFEHETRRRGPLRLGQELDGHNVVVHRSIQVAIALDEELRILLVVLQEDTRFEIVLATRLETALVEAAAFERQLQQFIEIKNDLIKNS